jgi:hypothetical protein
MRLLPPLALTGLAAMLLVGAGCTATPVPTAPADRDAQDQTQQPPAIDRASACQAQGGTWLEPHSECENVSQAWCDGLSGFFNECGSACRHAEDPLAPCTLQCIPFCGFSAWAPAADGLGEPLPPDLPEAPTSLADAVAVTSPDLSSAIASPLTLAGDAPGGWYFEATFPVVLEDAMGNVLAEGYATANSDWMTTELVPFTATLEFTAPPSGSAGNLVLKRSNASGLPEHDASASWPVEF